MSADTTTVTATGNTSGYVKPRNENQVNINISGTYAGAQFTVEATPDGTNWQQVSVVDLKTNLLVAGGTTLAPTDNVEYAWAFMNAANYVGVRLNVSAFTSGTMAVAFYGMALSGLPQVLTIAGGAGAFTNVTASGTLGVTGASTLTGNTSVGGTLGVTGATTLSSTVAVTGAASFSSSVLSSHATAGVGYATGAGGTVTQATSITTGVTINKTTGTITTVSSTLGAGVDASFTVTNSAVAATDTIVINTKSYGGTADGIPICKVQSVAAGSFVVNVHNQGAVALDAPVVMSFCVIKGVAA